MAVASLHAAGNIADELGATGIERARTLLIASPTPRSAAARAVSSRPGWSGRWPGTRPATRMRRSRISPRPLPTASRPAASGSSLATELTGPEIARRLFVSVNTLRTHTKHIFTKLDVNTRQAAVRRATELGLL